MTHSETAWAWWPEGREPVRILGRDELWGTPVVDVLSPSQRRMLRLGEASLSPLTTRQWSAAEVVWRAAALRSLALAAAGEPLAVRHGGVRLLPHQTATLTRALALDPVRLGLCDEVGLGKTITAGAIAAELRARHRIRRILVVAPKGVQLQWVAEMQERFAEDYVRVGPEGIPVDSGVDVWKAFDRIVTSLDAVKPLRTRPGWTPVQISRYNENRFHGLVRAGWDLVIIDEAHHVAGSDDAVARHKLGRELTASTANVLLLSATPHSGKSESFRRFLGLLDPDFFLGSPITQAEVARVIARTEKRGAVDDNGIPLFQPRTTHLESVPWAAHAQHRLLYDEVTDYVRDGYATARATGRTATGFLMLLFQRLVASSTPAILSALERRQLALSTAVGRPAPLEFDDWAELTSEEQDTSVDLDTRALLTNETDRLSRLVNLARACYSAGPDPKTLHFLRLIRRLRRDEGDAHVKVLVFTEFRATQQMLTELLESQGIATVVINGQMGLQERALAQQRFREDADVLVSTDAGGEGVNLQFAHLAVNWDLPWAPTRLEQRIGRVDRIGQAHPVKAFNLILEDSVDQRVLEVLEDKLATIHAELGADKRADILDSADHLIEDLYVRVIADPTAATRAGEDFGRQLREELAAGREARDLLQPTTRIDLSPPDSQLPTLLTAAATALSHLTESPVDDPADVLQRLPLMAPGEPVPVISGDAAGWFSLWTVAPSDTSYQTGCYAVFRTLAGRIDPHHAERTWQALCNKPTILGSEIPDPGTWETLTEHGRDFGYAPLQRLQSRDSSAPRVDLALLVRVVP